MRRLIVAGLTATAFATAGCSMLGGGGASPTTDPPAAPASTGPTGSSSSTASVSPAASASTTAEATTSASGTSAPTPADPSVSTGNADLGPVVSTRTGNVFHGAITAAVHPVLRDGAVSHLNIVFSSSVPDDSSEPGPPYVMTALSDNNSSSSDKTTDAADGIQLVDGKHAKVYLVASDGQGICLCSRGLNGAFAPKGRPFIVSATFAAPPSDVTAVDVRIPTFGTVRNVPVQ